MPVKDSRTAGAILGRAGANIRRVEMESKASLRLEDSDDGTKRLIIEGTADAIAKVIMRSSLSYPCFSSVAFF